MARQSHEFSSIVTKEGKWYVANSPEIGITSQGRSVESALENLKEAIELYLQDKDARVPKADFRPIVTLVKVVRA